MLELLSVFYSFIFSTKQVSKPRFKFGFISRTKKNSLGIFHDLSTEYSKVLYEGRNTVIASVAKVKFTKKGPAETERETETMNPATDMAFEHTQYTDLVMFNNKITTSGAIVDAKLKNKSKRSENLLP